MGNSNRKYTTKVDAPHYEPTNKNVRLEDCYDRSKYDKLISSIMLSDVTPREKEFLCLAATRHLAFDYREIANYYANNASATMQKLMEESALVIIDYEDAIKQGYVRLSKHLERIMENA